MSAALDSRKRLLGLYAGAAARAHVLVRWHTCPFPRIAASVPRQGRILEVGCGHGLFSAYLALQAPRRSVRGIDIDELKIGAARTAAERVRRMGGDLDFAAVPPGTLPPGPWDAIVIVDVLYLLSEAAQGALLDGAARLLAPGGVLVVKEMGCRPRWKFHWNRLQETLSVRVLGITRGGAFTFLAPERLESMMRERGLATTSVGVDRGRPHPHHLLVGRRP